MPQIQHRPEDPDEWGGLPSEPLDPATPAEELSVAAALDISSFSLGGLGGADSLIVDAAPADDDRDA